MWVEGRGDLPGQLVVVSGPSGCGKSSVIRAVRNAYPADKLCLSISATTRKPRPGEVHGTDYLFYSEQLFAEVNAESKFLETAVYNGNRYGTPAGQVFQWLAYNKTVLLEIEVQGALQVRHTAPTAFFVFIRTPTFRDLERRLRHRGTETEASIHHRLQKAREELAEAHWYDAQLVNDDFDACVNSFIELLKTYQHQGE